MNTAQPTYVLGHTDRELDRLTTQARMFEPFTRQLLHQAGICAGMRVLDVGCGSGDVAFLAADLVGPTGRVVGVDRASAAVTRASKRAQAAGAGNVYFRQGDPAEMEVTDRFDAVIGRLVMMYCPDPVDTLRKLAQHLRPGGVIAVQEIDMESFRSQPPSPLYQQCFEWINQTFRATRTRLRMGLELHSTFVEAGLPAPSLRLDATVGAGPGSPLYSAVAEAVRTLLPAMEKFKIATAEQVRIDDLEQRLRNEIGSDGVATFPCLIGAWARTAA
jgi:SAM-dependent methyltransferase